MITVEEAWQIIQSSKVDFGMTDISFDEGVGYVLREDIIADRDFPPFDRVSMDGIAIRMEEINRGVKSFSIVGLVAAGDAQTRLSEGENCVEIMTGAILPEEADTVIPYEWLVIENGIAKINVEKKILKGQNVHLRGRDKKQGDIIIHANKIIDSSDIGIFASVGKTKIRVSRRPRILGVSTGNELVPIDDVPLAHQIRRSNIYQLQALLGKLKITPDLAHFDDDKNEILSKLRLSLSKYDVVILSGGISAGRFDHIPDVLEELGVEKLFYKVKQKPGKPFWFGKYGEGCRVFGVPGNPVSSYVCMVRYIIPWLKACLNPYTVINNNYGKVHCNTITLAKLATNIENKSGLTQFFPVTLKQQPDSGILATPLKLQGSGDLVNLVEVDGFVEIHETSVEVLEGDIVRVYLE